MSTCGTSLQPLVRGRVQDALALLPYHGLGAVWRGLRPSPRSGASDLGFWCMVWIPTIRRRCKCMYYTCIAANKPQMTAKLQWKQRAKQSLLYSCEARKSWVGQQAVATKSSPHDHAVSTGFFFASVGRMHAALLDHNASQCNASKQQCLAGRRLVGKR